MASTQDPLPSPIRPHTLLSEYYRSDSERSAFVRKLFDRTAPDYNWISQVLSFGAGKRYRLNALQRAGLSRGMKALDIACGPGTLTCHVLKIVGEAGLVLGLDPSIGMLREAARNTNGRWIQGTSEYLPFHDETFDFVSMGYALRHMSDLRVVFREYYRVLKPGGVLLILEIASPHSRAQFAITKFYLKRVVPFITWVGTRNTHAHKLMRYFWETIESCVPSDQIIEAIQSVGLDSATMTEIGGGVIKDYQAVKPKTREGF